jgi:superfamily II DNA/RNA helicase
VHRAGRTARAGESGRVVTLVLSGQRREMSRLMAEAGIEPTITKVRSGEAELSRITGAKTPSGIPLDGGSAAPRPKNTNAPFRGIGTSKDTSGAGGGKSRKAGEARRLAEARKAAAVRRGG